MWRISGASFDWSVRSLLRHQIAHPRKCTAVKRIAFSLLLAHFPQKHGSKSVKDLSCFIHQDRGHMPLDGLDSRGSLLGKHDHAVSGRQLTISLEDLASPQFWQARDIGSSHEDPCHWKRARTRLGISVQELTKAFYSSTVSLPD